MGQSIVVKWDALRTAAFGAIGGAYSTVGTPFDHVVRILIMQNLTNQQVLISFDGVTDNLTLPIGGQLVLDYMSDQSRVGGEFAQPIGTQVYVKNAGVAPTVGNFYVGLIYAKGE